MYISQRCTGSVEQLVTWESDRSKSTVAGPVISDCSSLAGKQHFLSDRQLREITVTIWSGGSFITAYPLARPGLLLLLLPIPPSLFPLFTKAPQRVGAPWLWILNAVHRWALLFAFLLPYLFRALVIWADVRAVNAIGFKALCSED